MRVHPSAIVRAIFKSSNFSKGTINVNGWSAIRMYIPLLQSENDKKSITGNTFKYSNVSYTLRQIRDAAGLVTNAKVLTPESDLRMLKEIFK